MLDQLESCKDIFYTSAGSKQGTIPDMQHKARFLIAKLSIVVVLTMVCSPVLAQRGGGGGRGGNGGGAVNPPIASLKTVTVPAPTSLDTYVQDQNALVVLGKVLFWD